MKDKRKIILALLPFLILIIGFEVLPLISVVTSSFKGDDGTLSLIQYKSALTNEFYTQSIVNSLKIAIYSSLIGIVVSVIGSYSISKLNTKIREKVLILSNMTSNFSGVPLAFAFMIILGNNGVLVMIGQKLGWELLSKFDLYTSLGITIVYIYFQIPLGILLMYPSFDGIKKEWEEAAKILGASKLQFWKHVGIPVVLPSILGTLSILFANAIGAYATVVALTNSNFNLLPIRIGSLVSGDLFLNPELAGALAIILAIIVIITNMINSLMIKRRRWDM